MIYPFAMAAASYIDNRPEIPHEPIPQGRVHQPIQHPAGGGHTEHILIPQKPQYILRTAIPMFVVVIVCAPMVDIGGAVEDGDEFGDDQLVVVLGGVVQAGDLG